MTTPPESSAPPAFPFAAAPDGGPPPEYAVLRRTDPVRRVQLPTGHQAWLVTRYEDVRIVLTDHRFSREVAAAGGPQFGSGAATFREGARLNQIDPPDHTRMRRIMQHALAPRRMAQWRTRITILSNEILNRWTAAGPPADLVIDYATPLATQVACAVLGIPLLDERQLRRWSRIAYAVDGDQQADLADEINRYFLAQIATKRDGRTEDALTVIATIHREGAIDDGEAANLARSVLFGGLSTTVNLITRAVLLLTRHPGQRDRIRTDPRLVSNAVEEILRYAPVNGTGLDRLAIATEDLTLSGTPISAGDIIVSPLSAANRDPARFTDSERFDITRPDAHTHLAFGHGPHTCVGAVLGRIELECMLTGLVTRLPGLRLEAGEIADNWSKGVLSRRLDTLIVTWDTC